MPFGQNCSDAGGFSGVHSYAARPRSPGHHRPVHPNIGRVLQKKSGQCGSAAAPPGLFQQLGFDFALQQDDPFVVISVNLVPGLHQVRAVDQIYTHGIGVVENFDPRLMRPHNYGQVHLAGLLVGHKPLVAGFCSAQDGLLHIP